MSRYVLLETINKHTMKQMETMSIEEFSQYMRDAAYSENLTEMGEILVRIKLQLQMANNVN